MGYYGSVKEEAPRAAALSPTPPVAASSHRSWYECLPPLAGRHHERAGGLRQIGTLKSQTLLPARPGASYAIQHPFPLVLRHS